MAGLDGDWHTVVKSPLGDLPSTLSVATDGARWTGRQSGAMGSVEIADGIVDGETLRWSLAVSVPMPLKLECEATRDGDTLRGTVGAGAMGSFPLTGTRA